MEGYLQSLRERNADDIKKMIASGETGIGRSSDSGHWRISLHLEYNDQTKLESAGRDKLVEENEVAHSCVEVVDSECREEVESTKKGGGGKERGSDSSHDDEEIGVSETPVISSTDEYLSLTGHINPCLQHVPNDLLRFDCAGLAIPLREILYETDFWAKCEPTGLLEWELLQVPSGEEAGVG